MRIKHFILIAAVALVASSCAHSFEAEQTQQPAIGFGTWAEQLTKNTANGNREFVAGDDFAVYGFFTKNQQNTVVFDDQVVTAQNTNPVTWKYAPLRFWDPTAASYTFFAVSPASYGTETTVNAETGLFTSQEVNFATYDKDILVATKKVVNAAQSAPKYPSTAVELQFNHVAAMVDVKVKMDAALDATLQACFNDQVPSNAGLQITAASLVNITKKGSFAVASYDNQTLKPVIGSTNWGWVASQAQDAAGDYSTTVSLPLQITQTTVYDANHAAETTTGDDQVLFNHYVLMPQELSASTQQLHIAYDIITQVNPELKTSYSADIDIKDFVLADKDNNDANLVPAFWAPGTHYTYTLTIGANAITFTASINDWTVANPGYYYLVN